MNEYGGMKGSDALKKLREGQGQAELSRKDTTRPPRHPTPEMLKEYKESVAKLDKMLTYKNDMKRDFGDKGSRIIRRAIELMRPMMDKLMFKERKTGVTDDHCKIVHQALDVLLESLIYKSMTPMVKGMGMEFQRLAFNWNQQLKGNNSIRSKTQYVHRLTLGHLTQLETIETNRKLLAKLRDVFQRQPPAFDYSRHFREVLEDELSES